MKQTQLENYFTTKLYMEEVHLLVERVKYGKKIEKQGLRLR